jgi:hypothetical protein
VPLYRKYVFAQSKPSTRTRIDLGFALDLGNRKAAGKLIDTGDYSRSHHAPHSDRVARRHRRRGEALAEDRLRPG